MPILVQSVRISGFRGLSNLELKFGPRTVFIGANNSGKTSALKALQLGLGDSRFIGEEDFHVNATAEVASRLLVDVRIVPTDADGKVTAHFDRRWTNEFRREITPDQSPIPQSALMFRVKIERVDDQKRYYPERRLLKFWPKFEDWLGDAHVGDGVFSGARLSEVAPFYFQDAQRDIMEDAKLRSSYLGRVLAMVSYLPNDLVGLQEIIDDLNKEAIEKSDVLKALQTHLEGLGSAVANAGKAELSPIAKSVRDLTKGLRLNYEEGGNRFGMEYHGMGTRSWASLLVLKAFATIVQNERQGKAFSPLLALEEPEAHLHPNAQRQIYGQMNGFPGQVVISTHSPYVAAQCELADLRCFSRLGSAVKVCSLPSELSADEARAIRRRVVDSRGELLFARLVVLFEGETEEHALPLFFEAKFRCAPCDLGVCFVGVGGAGGYGPFLKVLHAFNISWLIFSDGEPDPLKKVHAAMRQIGAAEEDNRLVSIPDAECFESYLLSHGYGDAAIHAIDLADGAGAVDAWIRNHDGKPTKPMATDESCETCKQTIRKTGIRDYKGDAGLRRALGDKLKTGKTKYAPPFAEEILKISGDRRYPPIIRILLDRIQDKLQC